MSPIPDLTNQPRLSARQTSPSETILSITRLSTTYTTTLLASTPTTPGTSRPIPRSTDSDTPKAGVIIAAVLSSILGTLVLLTIFYKCCINNRSVAYIPPAYTSYSTSSFSSDDDGTVRRRGGGLHRHHHHYHHGVRRPQRARTRAVSGSSRRSEMSYSSRHGSRYGERYRSRTRAVRGSRNGMLGWFWMPATVYRYGDRRYGWPRERRHRDFLDD